MTDENLGTVSWTSSARQDLSPTWIALVDGELLAVYPAAEIIVKQRFSGYRDQPEEKLILAIEVQTESQTHSNVVKVGLVSEVGGDVAGWQAWSADRGTTSRLFIAPTSHDLPNDRVLVVYPDVYQFYFNDRREDEPSEFEAVVESSIKHSVPSPTSVERVLTQVFTEAHRCFYRHHSAYRLCHRALLRPAR